MPILLTTYGLMLIFTLFCAAQWHSAVNLAFMDLAATQNFMAVRTELTDLISEKSDQYYKESLPEKSKDEDPASEEHTEAEYIPPPPDSLNEELDERAEKGKRTSFLHIGILFKDETPNIVDSEGKACFTLLKNLLRELYQNQPFFENARMEIPDFEDRFVHNLLDKVDVLREKNITLTAAKELCNIDLEDDLQSYVRYKMFTGTKSRRKRGKNSDSEQGYYPLIEIVSLRHHEKLMSIWHAPRPLLMALFEDEEVVKDVIAYRQEVYNDLRNDKNKSAVQTKEQEFKRRFSQHIYGIDPKYIDFGVSRTYPKA